MVCVTPLALSRFLHLYQMFSQIYKLFLCRHFDDKFTLFLNYIVLSQSLSSIRIVTSLTADEKRVDEFIVTDQWTILMRLFLTYLFDGILTVVLCRNLISYLKFKLPI